MRIFRFFVGAIICLSLGLGCATLNTKSVWGPLGAEETSEEECSVTIEWDANSDASYYMIYYDYDGSGPEYEGTGADQGDSPITVTLEELDDASNPSYTLTGLVCGNTAYISLKAGNDCGNTSDYSDEVSTALENESSSITVSIGTISNLMFYIEE